MPKILYEFVASGHQAVEGAFDRIGAKAASANKIADEGARRMRASSREGAQTAARGADHQAKLAASVARDQEKNQKYVDGIRRRHFAEEQRKAEQADRLQQREATRAIQTKRKTIAAEIQDRQKHEGRLQDISRKASDKRAEGERRHQQTLSKIREESASRLAKISDAAKSRAAAREEARSFDFSLTQKRRAYEIDKKRRDIADKESDSLKSDIRGGIKGAVIGGSLAVGALGMGITGAAARDAMRLQEVSNRLSIASRGAGEEAVDPNVLRREFQQTAIKTPGIQAIDVADAVSQFVSKTGNLDVARKSQGVFATVASATGSQIQDVSAAAADLFQKFDITTVEGMADAMSALAFQGKAGAFELKDAASQFASMSAAAARFGLDKGAGGVRVLGGLAQIARSTTKSPEQAATAVNAMFRQFVSSSTQADFKKLGVKVFKDKGHTKTNDIQGLIVDTISKAGGDQTKLSKIFGDEGMGAMSAFVTEFNRAQADAEKSGLTGKDKTAYAENALKAFLDNMINASGDYAELQKDAAQAQQDSSAKLTAAWEGITAKIGEGTTPILQKLVDTLAESPGAIDAFVGTIDNVISFFALLVSATQDLLEVMGLATKKKKSPEDIRDEERKKAGDLQKRIEALDKRRGGSWDEEQKLRRAGKTKEADAMAKKLLATSGMDDERATLVGKMEVAKRKVGEANAEVAKVQDQQRTIRTADQFAKEYAALATPGQLDPETLQRQAQEVGIALRKNVGTDATVNQEGLLANENEAQRQLRVNQAMARREDSQNAGIASGGGDQADKGGGALLAAAKALAAAAGKLDNAAGKSAGQPSIVGPAG